MIAQDQVFPNASATTDVSPAGHSVELRPVDEAVFRRLYSELAPALRSYIRRGLGSPEAADDILQETFYRFLRVRLPPLEQAQMKAYLYRIATTLIADYWRRWKREQDIGWSLFRDEAPWTPDRTDDMTRMFQQLKPQQRGLLWLAYVEGMEHGEIAEALGLKPKSIKVLLFRARKKLASIFRKEGITPEVKS